MQADAPSSSFFREKLAPIPPLLNHRPFLSVLSSLAHTSSCISSIKEKGVATVGEKRSEELV